MKHLSKAFDSLSYHFILESLAMGEIPSLDQGLSHQLLVTRKKKPLVLNLDFGKKAIETVSSIKYLGIILSNDLSWSAHINATCCQAKRIIDFLYWYFHLADLPASTMP